MPSKLREQSVIVSAPFQRREKSPPRNSYHDVVFLLYSIWPDYLLVGPVRHSSRNKPGAHLNFRQTADGVASSCLKTSSTPNTLLFYAQERGRNRYSLEHLDRLVQRFL